MKVAIPIPNHLFGVSSVCQDNPQYDFYLTRTRIYKLKKHNPIEHYCDSMWIKYNPDIHGSLGNLHSLPEEFVLEDNLGNFDLLYTLYEGNSSFYGVGPSIIPIDLKIPQIWQSFGSYIHRKYAPWLYPAGDDRMNPQYYPGHAVFRFENHVVAEANQNVEGKVIWVSADPDYWNGWTGKSNRVLSIYSHGRNVHTNEYTEMLKQRGWWEAKDYEETGKIEKVSELRERIRNARVYVEPTNRYSPAGYPKVAMVGVPTVARNTREWNLWIQNGINGFLYKDKTECRVMIEKLLNDQGLCEQISKETRKKALENFSPSNNSEAWKELFEMAKKRFERSK